jgi:dihydroorotate dehydrogenase (fumarate)
MADLKVNYLGLTLKNPLVVSSSGLTSDIKKIQEMEAAGAAAVVLKSLFEEQILFETKQYLRDADYPEAEDYMLNYLRHHSVDEYLSLIEQAKEKTAIPIIASINCVSNSEWVDFARRIEKSGADALELNVFFLPTDPDKTSREYENLYAVLAEKIKSRISIPVSFKLGRQFTNLTRLINQLYVRKVEGVTLFNRFYEPDIDPGQVKFVPAEVFSHPSEIRQTLRWVGILSGQFDRLDFAASTGVHDGLSAIKLLFAGATVTEVCSILYKKGIPYLTKMISEIDQWLEKHGYASVTDIQGKMSYDKIPDPTLYERAQFMKYFSDIH